MFPFFCNSYPCEWGGVVSGKPYLKNLDQFGKTVLEDLWKAVVEQFVEVSLFAHPVNVKVKGFGLIYEFKQPILVLLS